MTAINTRRYDIDWIRVIAIGLLLIYHIAIGFQPWGLFIGFIQSENSINAIWTPMSMLNVWRIPLLFFVSGMGVFFAIKRRSWKALIKERTGRILIPYLFGTACIAPLHIIILQHYYGQKMTYILNPGHLWFLGNIFVYVLLLSPLFFYLKKHENGKIGLLIKKVFQSPFGFMVIVLSLTAEVIIVQPNPYELYAQTWHGFFLGLLAFLFGFCCVYSGKEFWGFILKWRWLLILAAAALYTVRILELQPQIQNYLVAAETCFWVFSVFAFGYKYLNRPSKALSYLSQAAYPIYIIHMAFLYLGSSLIFPLDIPVIIQFVLVVAFTFLGCFGFYELIIRRVWFLRPLFGLKMKAKTE
ncbi:acyltransferase [Roseivirga seohaensis]|uniref:Acyltransferase n=1 Tax=Roseivirga seohaensis TaxID=1914963 RepID=A0A150Y4A2_9BACT|nr:acyltransferase family protein [Roseivirga seohaensis]KYG85839.1 acyltransferase [Roseivirga seohaensis]